MEKDATAKSRFIPGRALIMSMALFLLVMSLAGCGGPGSYLGFWQKKQELANDLTREQSAELYQQMAPEDTYLVRGRLKLSREHDGPILVVAVTDRFKKSEIAAVSVMHPPLDRYRLHLQEGVYDLYFFADLDGNGYFENHEMVGRVPAPVTVARVVSGDGVSIAVPELYLDLAKPAKSGLALKKKVKRQSGIYESLDDEFFDPKHGEIGLYDPRAFMAHNQQYIFSLEKLDLKKTQVIFIHGFGGTPRNFKYLVDGLDRNRYQPWFYYYPSGMPLKKLRLNLANIIRYRHENNRDQAMRTIFVAHSMGGLVGLATLNELCKGGIPGYLKGYISFNTPYGGVDSAASGIKFAPAVVPAWRDVATGSPFLMELYGGGAHRDIPFYLFFGFNAGSGNDGTIDLQSQLDGRVHLDARKSYGFIVSHMGVLENERVREMFYRALSSLDGR